MDMRAASVRVEQHGLIPVVRFTGLLSAGFVAAAKYPLAADCPVLVSDMRRAVVVCAPHQMAEMICRHPKFRSFAAAVIAAPQNFALLRDFAWFCALRGVSRAVFLDPAAAMAWAVQRLALSEACGPVGTGLCSPASPVP
jgi:hypothetical protein